MADGTDADWGLAGPLALRLDPRAATARAATPAARMPWRRGVQTGVIVLHGVLLLALIEAMALRDGPAVSRTPAGQEAPLVIEFDLTDPVPTVSPPPAASTRDPMSASPVAELAPRADARPNTAAPRLPASAPAAAVATAAATPVAQPALETPRLFDSEGRPRLSQSVLDAAARAAEAPAPAWRERVFEPSPQFQPRRSTVPYVPTRFDRAWVADRETLGQELMRRSIVSRKVKTPWGTVWQCGGSLFLPVLVGCADVPPRPLERPPAGPGEAPRTPQHSVPGRDPLGE